ncbi:two component transcriptional regulator, winged helix family, partial [mine drainage metagenome]
MRIAVIEDDRDLARFLELELTHEGHLVLMSYNGEDGLQSVTDEIDLVLLDVMLPGMSGFSVLKAIRRRSSVPVVLLTARDRVEDKVEGLDLGADDYLTKPFSIEELAARIRSVARRNQGTVQDVLESGDLRLDRLEHSVTRHGRPISLTKREFDLLEYLLANAGYPKSREAILERVWGYDFYGTTNVVDVYIRQLRAKVDEPFDVALLHTVRGVGYVLKPPTAVRKLPIRLRL